MVAPGDKLTYYEILESLGQGGMGQVFLAHDTSLDRKVAVKVLSKEMEAESSARERFVREAKAAAGLDHPFVCKVYEAGQEGDDSYIVMEYVEGETLADRIRRGPLPMDEASKIAMEVRSAPRSRRYRACSCASRTRRSFRDSRVSAVSYPKCWNGTMFGDVPISALPGQGVPRIVLRPDSTCLSRWRPRGKARCQGSA